MDPSLHRKRVLLLLLERMILALYGVGLKDIKETSRFILTYPDRRVLGMPWFIKFTNCTERKIRRKDASQNGQNGEASSATSSCLNWDTCVAYLSLPFWRQEKLIHGRR